MLTNKYFAFNWLPPANCRWPSPSGSILKSFLAQYGISTHVKYWNLTLRDFQNNFLGIDIDKIEDPSVNLFPLLGYIAIKSNDGDSFNKVKYQILANHPQWLNMGVGYIDKRMREFANQFDKILDAEISGMQLEECFMFGISSKLSQWIPANIICEKVKKRYPALPIIIGGFGTKEEAFAIMKNFDYYNYAIWGEGEYPLIELCRTMDTKGDMDTIPYLIYRNSINKPVVSQVKKKNYLDLDIGVIPNFDDYFEQCKMGRKAIYLAIEGGRGCHWQQCKFCYLNDGYRYRSKSVETKIKEIKLQIEKYGVTKFFFLDNDIIGKDVKSFNLFLDQLIELRKEYQNFEIVLAEIITKEINHDIIKKMALAGFSKVQIGYESPSNEILKRINKKNSFASNLLFIKWAEYFSMQINGLYVIRGLLEETDDAISEGINNLYFLRFFLQNDHFEHNMSNLGIMKSSRYFDEIDENELNKWNMNPLFKLLPESYIDVKDRFDLFQFAKESHNQFWECFTGIEEYFKNGQYEYNLIKYTDKICYREFYNKVLISEFKFDNPLDWSILKLANHKVVSLQYIRNNFYTMSKSISEICLSIDSLKKEGLLYCTEDYSELVTVINTDLLST